MHLLMHTLLATCCQDLRLTKNLQRFHGTCTWFLILIRPVLSMQPSNWEIKQGPTFNRYSALIAMADTTMDASAWSMITTLRWSCRRDPSSQASGPCSSQSPTSTMSWCGSRPTTPKYLPPPCCCTRIQATSMKITLSGRCGPVAPSNSIWRSLNRTRRLMSLVSSPAPQAIQLVSGRAADATRQS